MPDIEAVDPDRITTDELIGYAEKAPKGPPVPVYPHPDVEPFQTDENYIIPGVRPDGSPVEFSFMFQGCFDSEAQEYVWKM